VYGIPWSEGVTLLHYRARTTDPSSTLAAVRAELRGQGLRLLPAARARRGRGWAQFVLADSREAQAALAGRVPCCIGVAPRRRPAAAQTGSSPAAVNRFQAVASNPASRC
jgi:hypothetical protein